MRRTPGSWLRLSGWWPDVARCESCTVLSFVWCHCSVVSQALLGLTLMILDKHEGEYTRVHRGKLDELILELERPRKTTSGMFNMIGYEAVIPREDVCYSRENSSRPLVGVNVSR